MVSKAQAAVSSWRRALVAELFSSSRAAKYGLSVESFTACLGEVETKYLPADAAEGEVRQFFKTLRIEELVLSRACAAGNEAAWTDFLNRYRAALYQAARAISRNDEVGRELADSLYADLYGIRTRESAGAEVRVSKLSFYMGRGSLEGWLRTVVAQEYINRYRSQKRLVSIEEESEQGVQFAAPQAEPAAVKDTRLDSAIDSALAQLAAEERYILASYFLDERTLAQVARSLGVHESTISRKVERIVKELRKRIIQALVAQGMSARAAEEALECDVRDLTVNVSHKLRSPAMQESGNRSFQSIEGED
jgi:RNA polymerase sigma-70 factor (ECF subfamily)